MLSSSPGHTLHLSVSDLSLLAYACRTCATQHRNLLDTPSRQAPLPLSLTTPSSPATPITIIDRLDNLSLFLDTLSKLPYPPEESAGCTTAHPLSPQTNPRTKASPRGGVQ